MIGKSQISAMVGAAFVLAAGAAGSQPQPQHSDAERAEIARVHAILGSQQPRFGDVHLPGADATLHLGQRFYFLDAAEAKAVLKEWGNPPAATERVLGIVFPSGKTFVSDTWGAVITFEPSGYVTDKDADKTDYDKLLRDAQGGEDAMNDEARKNGFSTGHLVGWAQPPSYDRTHHFLIWARDLKFSNMNVDTLNYDLRILGRRGVLSLNLVAQMPQLVSVRDDAATLASDAAFDPGSAYGDFKSGKDKTAEYGLAGLVAAGLGVAAAQKLGLIALILLFAKKAIVLITVGFAAVAGWLRRLFNRRKPTAPETDSPPAAAVSQEAPPESVED